MKRKSRTFHATDEEYAMIEAYARQRGHTVSSFARYAMMAEVSRHVSKNGLIEIVEAIVNNYLKTQSPQGMRPQGEEMGRVER